MKHSLARWVILAAGMCSMVRAASVSRETFEHPGSLEEASLSLGGGSACVSGGVVRLDFLDTTPLAIPDVATLIPSSPAFKGDFRGAGIEVIGFRFRSDGAPPSCLFIELSGGSSVFQRVVSVRQDGAWQYVMVPLADSSMGGWTVKRGSHAEFPAALADVRSIAIKIKRNGVAARAYELDDFFSEALPRASGAPGPVSSGPGLYWDCLQPGAPYVLQRSPSLSGPWSDALPVTPTNRLQWFQIPVEDGPFPAFFRLRGP